MKIKHAIGDDIHRQHTRVVFTGEGGADFTLAAGDTGIPDDIAVRAVRSSPAGRAEQDPDFVGSLGGRDAESGCGISGDMILAERVEEDRKLLKRIRHARLFWILADLHLGQIGLLDGSERRFIQPAESGLGRPRGVRSHSDKSLSQLRSFRAKIKENGLVKENGFNLLGFLDFFLTAGGGFRAIHLLLFSRLSFLNFLLPYAQP